MYRFSYRTFLFGTACMFACNFAQAATVSSETNKIVPDDARGGDQFGVSVAIAGNVAVIGSHGDDDRGGSAGSAYLYDVDAGQFITKLFAEDAQANDRFGTAVDIADGLVVVGSQRDSWSVAHNGAAYLFDAQTGEQIARLTASDGAPDDRFGHRVGVSEAAVIVGSYLDDDAGENSGAAYLFDTETGKQLMKLTPNEERAEGDAFGSSVAISGTTAVVGSRFADGKERAAGAAYVFDVATGEQISKLTADDGGSLDLFGSSVAVSGDIAIIGSERGGTYHRGAAYLFDLTTGEQLAKLVPDDEIGVDDFGLSVDLSDQFAVVGARTYDDDQFAYVFELETGALISKLVSSDIEDRDYFGRSVSVSGSTIIAGSYLDATAQGHTGSAYIFAPAPIPLPAAGWLLISAIAGMGLMRGRRKAA